MEDVEDENRLLSALIRHEPTLVEGAIRQVPGGTPCLHSLTFNVVCCIDSVAMALSLLSLPSLRTNEDVEYLIIVMLCPISFVLAFATDSAIKLQSSRSKFLQHWH